MVYSTIPPHPRTYMKSGGAAEAKRQATAAARRQPPASSSTCSLGSPTLEWELDGSPPPALRSGEDLAAAVPALCGGVPTCGAKTTTEA